MGLDIYFLKRKRSSENKSEYHEKELAYFRKVNCLVAFFEDQYGFDRNDLAIVITKEMVNDLIERCDEVLLNPELAPDRMPNTGGFFFGSTAYDEYYFDNLEDIIRNMKEYVLPEFDKLKDNEDIVFYTSW